MYSPTSQGEPRYSSPPSFFQNLPSPLPSLSVASEGAPAVGVPCLPWQVLPAGAHWRPVDGDCRPVGFRSDGDSGKDDGRRKRQARKTGRTFLISKFAGTKRDT
uniref:Uncharacterized protein n=1 Tax=Trichuris muris TaxID=70415 RepID=A0A5S6QHF2_TRIMR